MNLQESIRRILREIEEDRVQIRFGRNAERHFGTVQNIIISVDGEDITSEDDVPGLGKMNIVIKDGEIIVGDIFIPEKYRRKGIATVVYQKISDYFGLPIVNSTVKGFNQTKEGGYIWKNRDNFKPRSLQESIRRILREERSLKTIVRNLVKNKGFLKASNVVGSIEKVHEILDLKGTQEDMLFIVNTLLKHDLDEPICNFVVSKWFHSVRTLVNIPLVDPNNPDAWVNRSVEIDLEEKISDMIYKLGNGLVRGNDINVSAVRCKL